MKKYILSLYFLLLSMNVYSVDYGQCVIEAITSAGCSLNEASYNVRVCNNGEIEIYTLGFAINDSNVCSVSVGNGFRSVHLASDNKVSLIERLDEWTIKVKTRRNDEKTGHVAIIPVESCKVTQVDVGQRTCGGRDRPTCSFRVGC